MAKLVNIHELAKLRDVSPYSLEQLFNNNRDSRPEPVCSDKRRLYYDLEQITAWLDSFAVSKNRGALDGELSKRFLTGEFDCSIKRDSYQMKRIKAKHFPPDRSEKLKLKDPAGIR